MRLIFAPLFFSVLASAAYNCVCEDSWAAYPSVTLNCCQIDAQWGKGTAYMADVAPYACVNPSGGLDSSMMAFCCRRSGVKPVGFGGARCWV